MEEKRETFTYTYSAARQEEIKRIREKYAPAAQGKISWSGCGSWTGM